MPKVNQTNALLGKEVTARHSEGFQATSIRLSCPIYSIYSGNKMMNMSHIQQKTTTYFGYMHTKITMHTRTFYAYKNTEV